MRASRATVEARTVAMVRLLKAGLTDERLIRNHVQREAENPASPWYNGRPLHRVTVWRYFRLADRRLKAVRDRDLDRVIARHIAHRIEAYELALADDDIKTALSVLDSLARIEGVTPEGQLAAALDRAKELEERADGRSQEAGGRMAGAAPFANGGTNGNGHH